MYNTVTSAPANIQIHPRENKSPSALTQAIHFFLCLLPLPKFLDAQPQPWLQGCEPRRHPKGWKRWWTKLRKATASWAIIHCRFLFIFRKDPQHCERGRHCGWLSNGQAMEEAIRLWSEKWLWSQSLSPWWTSKETKVNWLMDVHGGSSHIYRKNMEFWTNPPWCLPAWRGRDMSSIAAASRTPRPPVQAKVEKITKQVAMWSCWASEAAYSLAQFWVSHIRLLDKTYSLFLGIPSIEAWWSMYLYDI